MSRMSEGKAVAMIAVGVAAFVLGFFGLVAHFILLYWILDALSAPGYVWALYWTWIPISIVLKCMADWLGKQARS